MTFLFQSLIKTDAFTLDKLLLQWSQNGVILSQLELTNYDVEQERDSADVDYSDGRSIVGNDVWKFSVLLKSFNIAIWERHDFIFMQGITTSTVNKY